MPIQAWLTAVDDLVLIELRNIETEDLGASAGETMALPDERLAHTRR